MCQKLILSSSTMAPKKSWTVVTAFLKKLTKVCSFGTFGQKDGPQINADDKGYVRSQRSPIEETFIKPNWSELPEDNVEEILNKIDKCEDYLCVSSVCTTWRSIALRINSHTPFNLPIYHFLPKKNPIPMLLQPSGEDDEMHYLYSTTEQKVYGGLYIPELSNKWIPGSANEWLVTVDVNDVQMNLLNPLTRVQISLPPISAFQKPHSHLDGDRSDFIFVQKVYISSDPVDDSTNCLFVAMVSCKRTLSFCKIGDYRWKKLEPSIIGITDVILYKGLLYATDYDGKLFSIEIYPITKVTIVAKLELLQGFPHYLVKSSGDLLLVVRIYKPGNGIKTVGFLVYKLVETQSAYGHEYFMTEDDATHYQDESIKCAWKEIKSLNGQMLFIGHNRCESLDPSLYPRSKENCIYFADGNLEQDLCRLLGTLKSPHDFCGLLGIIKNPHDIGFYDMKNRKIEQLPGLSKSSSSMSSIWLSPKLK